MLSDLKLGEQVNVELTSRLNGRSIEDFLAINPLFLKFQGVGTIIGIDNQSSSMPVMIGWKNHDPDRMFNVASKLLSDVSYIADIDQYIYRLWISIKDIVSKVNVLDPSLVGATCRCGFDNPYWVSNGQPYLCKSCQIWRHISR